MPVARRSKWRVAGARHTPPHTLLTHPATAAAAVILSIKQEMKIENIDNTLEEIQEVGEQMRAINEAVAQVTTAARGRARRARACARRARGAAERRGRRAGGCGGGDGPRALAAGAAGLRPRPPSRIHTYRPLCPLHPSPTKQPVGLFQLVCLFHAHRTQLTHLALASPTLCPLQPVGLFQDMDEDALLGELAELEQVGALGARGALEWGRRGLRMAGGGAAGRAAGGWGLERWAVCARLVG